MNQTGTFKSFADRLETADLLQEKERLKSFAMWPAWSRARTHDLAKTGFYFTGEKDKVKCVECSLEFAGWTIDQTPAEVHKTESPYCPMITGISSNNIPLPEEEKEQEKKKKEKKTKMENGSLLRSHGSLDMQKENNRLGTFSTWPANSPVKPPSLARAGFYYLGPHDRVECAFCHGKLYNFVPGDDALVEHTRHFPLCGFARQVAEKEKNNTKEEKKKKDKAIASLGYSELVIEKAYDELKHRGIFLSLSL